MLAKPDAEGMVDLISAAAKKADVDLIQRFAIMRYWADQSVFDFYVTERDTGLAQRVHECLGRALGTLVIAAAHLQSFENKTGK